MSFGDAILYCYNWGELHHSYEKILLYQEMIAIIRIVGKDYQREPEKQNRLGIKQYMCINARLLLCSV